jgi:prepilin-type N-terminal cleavage/methylation domain-containing protein
MQKYKIQNTRSKMPQSLVPCFVSPIQQDRHWVISPQRGFTIIETLVAITILMIAIAGPLTIASQALHAAQDAKNQMIAMNLAQEAVEEIRNLKDDNIANTPLGQIFANYQDPNTSWGVEAAPGRGYIPGSCVSLGDQNCSLKLSPDSGYSYSPGGALTPFRRSFTVTAISDTEYLLTVTVTWTTGTVPNQIQIIDLLSATGR